MRHLKLYEELSKEKRIYTLKEVQKIQSVGFYSSDIIFDAEPNDKFELMEVTTSFIKHSISLDHYKKAGMDEDISIVENLIERYDSGQYVGPIVIDENGKIMDGIHRYVAQKELGRKNIEVFKRIGEIKLENIRVLSNEEIREDETYDDSKLKWAYHVVHPDNVEPIKSSGRITPSSAKARNLPDTIRGYTKRLFLGFDMTTVQNVVDVFAGQGQRWEDEGRLSDTAKVLVIDWQAFKKENPDVKLYKDKDFQYYEEEEGRLGGTYIKSEIPYKFVKRIMTLK